MVLTDQEALARIIKPVNGKLIATLVKEYEQLKANVTGCDFKNEIPALPQFEREDLREERFKMAIPNVDLLSRILKPRTRIFNAKGGVEHFIINNTKKEDLFRNYIDSITNGMSLKRWIQNIAIKKNDYDPNGIILVEVDSKKRIYPCFKSISEIHDRELDGRTPEYLILKLSAYEINKLKNYGIISKTNNRQELEYFRVIDDTTDRICTKTKVIKTIDNFSRPTFPGIVSSNIYGDEEDTFLSPLNDMKWLLKKYSLRSSINNVVVARQGFPKEWMQWFDCPNCEGTGILDGYTCKECKGMKCMPSQKHSDVVVLDWRGEDMKNVPIAPMGNVEAATDTLHYFAESLEHIEDKAYCVLWGMYKSDKGSVIASPKRETVGSNIEPTAYQAMLNNQPMVTQLVEFGKWYSEIYKFCADLIGFHLIKKSYKGSAIIGGDRFMIESPDATWDRYLKAVQAKAPSSELDSILIEYIENKYCNNIVLYKKYMLLLRVEPFLHIPIEDVLKFDIPEIQKKEKVYYNEWSTSLNDWEFTKISNGIGDVEDENEVVEEPGEVESEQVVGNDKLDPVANLKKSLRDFVLTKLKQDEGVLPKSKVDPNTGLEPPTPTSAVLPKPEKPKPKTKKNI